MPRPVWSSHTHCKYLLCNVNTFWNCQFPYRHVKLWYCCINGWQIIRYFILLTLLSSETFGWSVCAQIHINVDLMERGNRELVNEPFHSAHTPVRHFLELPVDCFLSCSSLLINVILFQQFMETFWYVMADFKQWPAQYEGSCLQLINVFEKQRERERKEKTWSLRNKRRLDWLKEWGQNKQATFFFFLLFCFDVWERKGWAQTYRDSRENPNALMTIVQLAGSSHLLHERNQLYVSPFPILTPLHKPGNN